MRPPSIAVEIQATVITNLRAVDPALDFMVALSFVLVSTSRELQQLSENAIGWQDHRAIHAALAMNPLEPSIPLLRGLVPQGRCIRRNLSIPLGGIA